MVVPLSFSLFRVDPDDQVHDFFSGKEGITHGEKVDTKKCILHDTHDRCVVFGRDYLLRDVCDVFEFRNGLIRLRDVHVHLVTVEISVIRGTD